jgi:hypothetical protein
VTAAPEARPAAHSPERVLPPPAARFTGRGPAPSPLVERLGLRLLAMPMPLAACAGAGFLVVGALALLWLRPGRR